MRLLLSARSRSKFPSSLILSLAAFATLLSLFSFYKQLNAPTWTRSEQREVQHDVQLVQYATTLETNTLVLQPAVTTAILILFHRCGHSPLHWWHSSPGCRECQGLPEQVAIVRAALQRGMGVMALQSRSRRSHCWDTHHPQHSRDMPEVLREVKRVERLQGWQGLPRFALGNSEGGAMALILARSLELKGVCSQVMGIPPSQLAEPSRDGNQWRFPPTVFVHMSRDKTTAAWIEQDIKVLQQQGVPTKEIRVDGKLLSQQYFSDRIGSIDADLSASIYSALRTAELVNPAGQLLKDPRPHSGDWKQAVQTIGPGNLSYHDMLGVQQELNVAWGGHEITADPIEAVLDWFERPTKPKSHLKMHGTFLPARNVPVDESALP